MELSEKPPMPEKPSTVAVVLPSRWEDSPSQALHIWAVHLICLLVLPLQS